MKASPVIQAGIDRPESINKLQGFGVGFLWLEEPAPAADISGGNSGSPTVNWNNELVGIVFDGNMESLPNAFVYDETRARTVHVAVDGIVEALRKLYHTDSLLEELLN